MIITLDKASRTNLWSIKRSRFLSYPIRLAGRATDEASVPNGVTLTASEEDNLRFESKKNGFGESFNQSDMCQAID